MEINIFIIIIIIMIIKQFRTSSRITELTNRTGQMMQRKALAAKQLDTVLIWHNS